jgi:hypothetical protein
MNINKLILKTMLMGALGVASIGLSSCDDDGGNSGPDIGENNAEASTEPDPIFRTRDKI